MLRYHGKSCCNRVPRAGRLFIPAVVSMLVGAVLTGCFENYGRFRPSLEIGGLFESYRILPDYKYYYSGPEVRPDAIIGIHQDYVLDDSMWYGVNLTPATLTGWMQTMAQDRLSLSGGDGAAVLDPSGKQIGIWYSPWRFTAVKMLADNRVIVHPPLAKPEPEDHMGRSGFYKLKM
ncbi:MAG: hypothetical protein Q8P24_02460 [Desulfobacterales bacterium]|nr:hypothetical protein [Desulfobacterales bacterium]